LLQAGVEGKSVELGGRRTRQKQIGVACILCRWCFHRRSGDNIPMSDFRALYIDEAFRSMRGHKRLAGDAIAQLSDEQFFAAPDPESNSVAIIVKHLAVYNRTRFTE